MARISFVLFTALLAGSLALHQGPSPLVRIAENDGLKKLLHESAVRLAYAAKSTPFDGKIKGVFKRIGTKINYSGKFHGKHIGNELQANLRINMTGLYRMLGWNGKFSAGAAIFPISMLRFKKFFRLRLRGEFISRFLGTVDGKPASMKARGAFGINADSLGMFSATESGSFEAIIGGEKAIGTYMSELSNYEFSTSITGTVKGHKFKFLFKGTIGGMYKLFQVHNSGTIMGSYGGEPFKIPYDHKWPVMIKP